MESVLIKTSFLKPLALCTITGEQFDAELKKDSDSMKFGNTYYADEEDVVLAKSLENKKIVILQMYLKI